MKLAWSMRLLFVAGLAATLALVIFSGVRPILQLLSDAGWRLLWLVPLHALPLALDVAGWNVLIVPRNRLRTLFFIASIREACNRLLPVANIGGEIVGVGLLSRRGTDWTTAAASVVVETFVTLVAQFLFVSLGILCLATSVGLEGLAMRLALVVAISLPLLVVLLCLLRYGAAFEWLGRIARHLLPQRGEAGNRGMAEDRGAALDARVRGVLRMRRALVIAVGWQFLGLSAGCAETWCALRWMGHPAGWPTALVLESLTQAVRHFVFFVPAGLGVQEAGLMALGAVLGIHADVVVALSLAKRMREILFGVPALMAWQWQRTGKVLVDQKG
jgi:putative membrane protein